MRTGVYAITCSVTGSQYIGSAAISFAKRFAQHRHDLRKGAHKSTYMQRTWAKYSEQAFVFEVLETCEPERAVALEQVWLDRLRPKFNTAKIAGSSLGIKRSAETLRRSGDARRLVNLSKPDKGVGHLLRVVKSPEFRAAQSLRMRKAQAEGRYLEANRKGAMTRTRKHFVHGEWLTIRELADKYNRSAKSLSRRIERGAEGDEIVLPRYQRRSRK